SRERQLSRAFALGTSVRANPVTALRLLTRATDMQPKLAANIAGHPNAGFTDADEGDTCFFELLGGRRRRLVVVRGRVLRSGIDFNWVRHTILLSGEVHRLVVTNRAELGRFFAVLELALEPAIARPGARQFPFDPGHGDDLH